MGDASRAVIGIAEDGACYGLQLPVAVLIHDPLCLRTALQLLSDHVLKFLNGIAL
jgi:hypothetical protein